MNQIKKLLGYVWMVVAPAIICFLLYQAITKISIASEATRANVILQWVIILLIFTPICVGFFIFGKYASQDAYANLPSNSAELED
jgi:ABC-type polysaccharide/polyol phosphate export permease